MKIALIQLSNKHTEIFGTFLEFFLKNEIDFTIYYNTRKDQYTFLKYYKKLFQRIFDVRDTERLIEEKEEYDKLIFSTSDDGHKTDDWFRNDENANKIIFVHHLASHWAPYMMHNLIVSPVVNLRESRIIIPIYKQYGKLHCNLDGPNNMAIVGAIKPHQKDKDLSLLIDLLEKTENLDYKIKIFMRNGDWNVIVGRYPFLGNHPKIEFYPGLKTDEMIEKLRDVKFIIPLAKKNGWNYNLRLTGSIPLAVNLNLPLIMDKKLANIYDLSAGSVLYNDLISEVIENVVNMDKNDYLKLLEGIAMYKRDRYIKNKGVLCEILGIKNRKNEN